VRFRRADGQYRWFAVDRVALRDEGGRVIKWYRTAYDVEDRKRAEEALRSAIDGIAGLVASWPRTVNSRPSTARSSCILAGRWKS
jgi:hypothetical protein